MTRMTFNAQHLGDDLKLLARFAGNFESNATTYLWQLAWQVDQRSFRANVFSRAFGDDMRTARLVPLSAHFEAREITWS